MRNYRLSEQAKIDLGRIYWRGVQQYGETQAERYYEALTQRFEEIGEAPYKYQAVEHIREGYRRSVCGVDNIYYRITEHVEIMRILGRQDVDETL